MTETSSSTASATSWRGVYLANGVSLLLLGWIGWRFLWLGVEGRSAPAVALVQVPPWPFYALVLATAVGLAAFGVVWRLMGKPPTDRLFRLLPVAAVLLLAVHFFLLPPYLPPVPSDRMAATELSMFKEAFDGPLPDEPAALMAKLPQVPPPYLRRGAPLASWSVVVRTACEGPILEVPAGVEVGTLLWCLSTDRKRAFVTAVGTGGELVGGPAVVQFRGKPAVEIFEATAEYTPPTVDESTFGPHIPQPPSGVEPMKVPLPEEPSPYPDPPPGRVPGTNVPPLK